MKYRDIFFHDTRQHCTIEKLFKTRIYTVVPVASQYIISPDSHPSQLQNSGFKYSQAPDIQCVQNKTNTNNRITSCFMSKMKQLFKGYHNNKSDGRFFVVFVVITPVLSAGAKKKKKNPKTDKSELHSH